MTQQSLRQIQEQRQVMAPQMRQSLRILQVPALELRSTILEELQSNPTLEEIPMENISLERESSDGDTPDQREEMDFKEDFEILNKMDEDFREYFNQENAQRTYTTEDAERRQHFFDSLVSETSLQEHLMNQAELSECSKEECDAIAYLIGSLDDRGFLSASLEDIAEMSNIPLSLLSSASGWLKSFDPPGIGSENLQECLILQLKQKKRGNSLAVKIIKHHFPLMLRRRIPDLAKKLGVTLEDIQDAIEEISSLDPAPGRKFSEDNNQSINPDVTVERDGDKWTVVMNNDYIPRLRISTAYKAMMAKGTLSSNEKNYIQSKIQAGRFLINAIAQRQQTIERITWQLLEFQREFFEEGKSKLKPLTMNQIAEVMDVHETTISRAIANKYISTPYGVFDFKFFFTSGYQSEDGEQVSNTTVKDRIKKIIDQETPSKPYSDQQIADMLTEDGFKVARRTVAKYREALGILPTNLRRRYE